MKRRYLTNAGQDWWLVFRTRPKRTNPLIVTSVLLNHDEIAITAVGRKKLAKAGRFAQFNALPLPAKAVLTMDHEEIQQRIASWLDWFAEREIPWSLDFDSEVERRHLKSVSAIFSFESDRDAVEFMLSAG